VTQNGCGQQSTFGGCYYSLSAVVGCSHDQCCLLWTIVAIISLLDYVLKEMIERFSLAVPCTYMKVIFL